MSTASDTRPDTTRVFISYRREDSAGSTGRLYDSLVERLGKDSEIFLDVDSIDAGVDFVDRVNDAVAGCDVALVVIGRQWSNARTADGSRRLDDPSDFVRLEIEAALNAGVLVLPILVDGGVMPHADDLPVSLQPFLRREAVELSHNRWRYDVDRLVGSIRATPTTRPTSRRKLAWIVEFGRRPCRSGRGRAGVLRRRQRATTFAWRWNPEDPVRRHAHRHRVPMAFERGEVCASRNDLRL